MSVEARALYREEKKISVSGYKVPHPISRFDQLKNCLEQVLTTCALHRFATFYAWLWPSVTTKLNCCDSNVAVIHEHQAPRLERTNRNTSATHSSSFIWTRCNSYSGNRFWENWSVSCLGNTACV